MVPRYETVKGADKSEVKRTYRVEEVLKSVKQRVIDNFRHFQ